MAATDRAARILSSQCDFFHSTSDNTLIDCR